MISGMTRRTSLAAAALCAAVLSGGILKAQTFEQSVFNVLSKESALSLDMSILRQDIDRENAFPQDSFELASQRGGGHHPGGGGRHPGGGGRPGGGHPPTHGNPGHWNPGHGTPPGHHNPGRPGHGQPFPQHPHRDWNRWHNHPGWGQYHRRWDWDAYGRPHWWGWVVWRGPQRAACFSHYGAQLNVCSQYVAQEENHCLQSCGPFGDQACVNQCVYNSDYGRAVCREDYDLRVRTCPF